MLKPGGRWSGECQVVALDAFAGKPLHRLTFAISLRVHVQRVMEALPVSKEVFFPHREARDECNETYAGLEAHPGRPLGAAPMTCQHSRQGTTLRAWQMTCKRRPRTLCPATKGSHDLLSRLLPHMQASHPEAAKTRQAQRPRTEVAS